MQNKTKTKLWIVLILTTLVIGGGLASYVGQEGLFKGLLRPLNPVTSGGDIANQSILDSGTNVATPNSAAAGADRVADQSVIPGATVATNCSERDSHSSCIAYTECLWDITDGDSGGACMTPTTPEPPDGYRQEPVLEVGKDTSLSGSTIPRGTNNVLVGAFKLKNVSGSTIEVDAMMFHKNTPIGSSYSLDNEYLSNIKIYGDGREITAISDGRLESEDNNNSVSFSSGRNNDLFTIIHGGTKNINIRANISPDAPVGKRFRFELLENSIRTNNPVRTRLAPGNTLPIRSASFTIGVEAAAPAPAAVNCSTYTERLMCMHSGVCYWHPQPGATNGGTCSNQPPPPAAAEVCSDHASQLLCLASGCRWNNQPGVNPYNGVCYEAPPPATPTMTVALAAGTPAAREVDTGEFFEATKINFAVAGSDTFLVPEVTVDARPGLGANALSPDKIDKIQLCTSYGSTAESCSIEYLFNAGGTAVSLMFGEFAWNISQLKSPQTLTIKAKLKSDADAGKRFALGIKIDDSINVELPNPANVSGSFPIWGNEMTVVTPLVCTGGQNNVDGVCVCPAPLFYYTGGAAGTHYSPRVCIPCTVAELINSGSFYCPADVPARPITCNSLSIAPDGFPSNNPTQNFTAVVEPIGFTGTVTWTHLKNGSSVETKTGRQALFPRLDATSVITANARPETSGRICSDQVLAGAPVVTNDLPVDDGGGGRYVRINRGGYDVGFDQTGAAPIQPAPTNSANVSASAAPAAAPAAPDLSSSQRLRSAPERGNTGPSAIIYVIAMAGIYGSRALRRKFRRSR